MYCTTAVSSTKRSKSPPKKKKTPPKLSEKEQQEELERKLERNRQVFEAWLERKKDEQKVS